MATVIDQLQPSFHVPQPDATPGFVLGDGNVVIHRVLYPELEKIVPEVKVHLYKIGAIGIRRYIFKCIFHKGDDQQGRQREIARISTYGIPDIDGISLTQLLQLDIVIQVNDLLFDGYLVGIAFIQLVAEHVGKFDEGDRRKFGVFPDEHINAVDRVEQEMGVHLGFEELKLIFRFFLFQQLGPLVSPHFIPDRLDRYDDEESIKISHHDIPDLGLQRIAHIGLEKPVQSQRGHQDKTRRDQQAGQQDQGKYQVASRIEVAGDQPVNAGIGDRALPDGPDDRR